ncbi:hypothetical protein UPYG_G00062400 [Umbra pygmaea]|uniref:Uncharacterized protein n=1 Tax=Umbra pygmaea TaxID=75934 RepID=A0ABD0XRI9_UMBPY
MCFQKKSSKCTSETKCKADDGQYRGNQNPGRQEGEDEEEGQRQMAKAELKLPVARGHAHSGVRSSDHYTNTVIRSLTTPADCSLVYGNVSTLDTADDEQEDSVYANT